jgi:hypothetical protein
MTADLAKSFHAHVVHALTVNQKRSSILSIGRSFLRSAKGATQRQMFRPAGKPRCCIPAFRAFVMARPMDMDC